MRLFIISTPLRDGPQAIANDWLASFRKHKILREIVEYEPAVELISKWGTAQGRL